MCGWGNQLKVCVFNHENMYFQLKIRLRLRLRDREREGGRERERSQKNVGF